jgi:mannose-6-phosphate isomerase-like protein (cupin superfamily)
MADAGVISITAAATALTEAWRPVDLKVASDAIVRLARLDGEFPWHAHDEDELFLCWSGGSSIEFDGQDGVRLGAGGLFVVPRGTRHRPVASDGPAYTLLLERPETKQHGND